ncbi:MAG: diaminopropionate ammonia-lyase [Bacteroidales bacterium]|jgi:diaminopropionate ammonia-lyase|nr:diaminopropionate ammonia-lyase [Bacteroidales bacterium]MDD4214362.1 diaminopropionate ammonia-lyase [Bacteroidales bacterium]
MCKFIKNPFYKDTPEWSIQKSFFLDDGILRFHSSLQGYEPTPVHCLQNLAHKLGIKAIFIKDESFRFDVKAFKIMGASYAIFCVLKSKWENEFNSGFTISDFKDPVKMSKLGSFTFCAATDGNHGRAVAWTARKLGQKAKIYMPSNSVLSRIENIKNEGAEVILVDGTYDDCVNLVDADARAHGWIVISDTAYKDNMYFPQQIMAGYTTIFREMENSVNKPQKCEADVVILQAGVGGLTAAGIGYFVHKYGQHRPKIICLEPQRADSVMESIINGKPSASANDYNSIMAGLNCTISLLAWDYIKEGADYLMTVSDAYAEKAMRQYYYPIGQDPQIISGESGAASMAGFLALFEEEKLAGWRMKMGINSETSVLLINTEGDTDPENFKRVVGLGSA